MLKFNNNSIVTGQIKQLLSSFNLPMVKVIDGKDDTSSLVEGGIYLDRSNNIIYKYDGKNFIDIQRYVLNNSYINITKNLQIRNMIYDTYTHEYLGNYLRFVRDYFKINLMSMYNCFSNSMINNINYTDSYTGCNFDSSNTAYKLYRIPIKFNQKYTIAINADRIEILPCLYSNNKLISTVGHSQIITGCSYSSPFLVNKITPTKRQYTKEGMLCLIIKVQSKNTSSLTVLEGDYVNAYDRLGVKNVSGDVCASDYIVNTEKLSSDVTNLNLPSFPQLLSFNTQESYPFADKLIEYLSGNVITNVDPIKNNILGVQKRLRSKSAAFKVGIPGKWNDSMRYAVFGILNKNFPQGTDKYDLLGYVDSEGEREINREGGGY